MPPDDAPELTAEQLHVLQRLDDELGPDPLLDRLAREVANAAPATADAVGGPPSEIELDPVAERALVAAKWSLVVLAILLVIAGMGTGSPVAILIGVVSVLAARRLPGRLVDRSPPN
ncbi:MAG: hypothetical protein AAGA99_12785 [Actinomycetota bacterium]